MFYGMVYYCTNNEWMPMILQTKIYSSLVYHNSFFFFAFFGVNFIWIRRVGCFFFKKRWWYILRRVRKRLATLLLTASFFQSVQLRLLIKVGIVWKEERNVTIQCSWSISCDDGSNSKWKKRRMLVKSCHPRWYRYFFFSSNVSTFNTGRHAYPMTSRGPNKLTAGQLSSGLPMNWA